MKRSDFDDWWQTWMHDILRIAEYTLHDQSRFMHAVLADQAPLPAGLPTARLPGPALPEPPLLATRELAPFVVGPPITHPRQFFGREALLSRIFAALNHYPLQHIALIGPRRSGKTSVLNYLMHSTSLVPWELRPGQRYHWLQYPAIYRWICVDFLDARWRDVEKFLAHLLQELGLSTPTPCHLSDFMDAVNQALQTPTIILLDALDVALHSSEFGEPLWGSLQAWATHQVNGNLAFVVTSEQPLDTQTTICGQPLPFFNIFRYLKLGPFTEAEARELIASSPEPFAPADVAWIIEHSKCWPALLQILCDLRLSAFSSPHNADTWKHEGLHQLAKHQHLLHI